MKRMKKKLIVALSATALGMTAAAGLAKQGWADDSASQIPTTGEKLAGAPDTATLPWGTFTLNPRIAAKVKAHEPINYVFSYQGSGIPLFSQQYMQGFKRGCEMGKAIYPMNCSAIAPVQTDPNLQISQIEAKLAAQAIDCISIEPVTSDSTTAIVNKLMAQGIPVFTAGVTSRGHEFTNFTQTPLKEGATAAEVVLKWMDDTGNHLKVFAVSGGDPAQFWSQGRMKGFREAIQKAIPDAKFVVTETNAINTSYDPGKTFDTYKAFLSAHPEVEFIENIDIGAEYADKAIVGLGRQGKAFTIGWNVSKGQLDAIENGVQVALLDQRWPDQAAFGGPACAQFLANGVVLPNTQTLRPVLKADVAQARAELDKTMSGN
jgi:ABC-type sugar transport system substrate-binding protein